MPYLSLPTEAAHVSFQAAMAEFRAEGRGGGEGSTIDSDIARYADTWHTSAGFASYLAALRADRLEQTPRPEGWVPCTTWWWVEGESYLGRIALRHRLTRYLLEAGGHIGYDVRPSARRRGHATAMLGAVLAEAATMGITSALITCDTDNVASRRTIERNGGVLEDERGGKLRFWAPTDTAARRHS